MDISLGPGLNQKLANTNTTFSHKKTHEILYIHFKCESLFKGMSGKQCGKSRKCWLPAVSPFQTLFSNGFFIAVKPQDCVVKNTTTILIYQSSRSRKIVRESRINEIKHVQTDKPLREFTHKNHLKRHFRSDRFS